MLVIIDFRCRYKFNLRETFDSLDTTVVDAYLNYKPINSVTYLEFRQQMVRGLLGRILSALVPSRRFKRKAAPAVIHDHLPLIMPDRKGANYISQKRHGEPINVCVCHLWGSLRLQSDCNCFTEFHTE